MTTALRRLLVADGLITAHGASTALFVHLINSTVSTWYATGAGVADMNLGVPDIGLATMRVQNVV